MEELTFESADGETYVLRPEAEGPYMELAVLSSGPAKHELGSILFFPDELDDVAALFVKAAKALEAR